MNIIFLDTETTCFTSDYDKLEHKDICIQLAYIIFDSKSKEVIIKNTLSKPLVNIIKPNSSTIHGLVQQDIDNEVPLSETEEFKFLEQFMNENKCIIVAHNADFDIDVLKRSGMKINKDVHVIDTLKIASIINDEESLVRDTNSLQYLKYYYTLYTDKESLSEELGLEFKDSAHEAISDILDLILYYRYLIKEYNMDLKQMYTLTEIRYKLKYIPFGKNKMDLFSTLSYNQLKYYETLDKDVKYTAQFYLGNT